MNNFNDMLSKAKEMQEKMREVQDKIKKIQVEGSAGGNLVKVTLSGDYEIKFKQKSIKLRGEKLVYVIGSIDTKKIKNLNITWIILV